MNNQNRVITVVTLAAATLTLAGTAHAAAPAPDGRSSGNDLGRAVSRTLADPSGTVGSVLDATEVALSAAQKGLETAGSTPKTGRVSVPPPPSAVKGG
ncbi:MULTISPECIES: hypothetical protein [unclassified Streptomyces]|uniref:hypothetical protein n=1 Tax=unclassified Streptomyces TaxID=2593676 RepID=UPI000746E8D2|nr:MULTISPECIES: hypothetical protein [unclassified Streptomyces]KUL52969.1 hypothetical protein ADL30_21820 [Streptomyces sp. NRRL S-1521]THC51909.1 hypothetical protein E7X58_13015 [Streptomyces sp. A1499]